jgi:hypothetical protein
VSSIASYPQSIQRNLQVFHRMELLASMAWLCESSMPA